MLLPARRRQGGAEQQLCLADEIQQRRVVGIPRLALSALFPALLFPLGPAEDVKGGRQLAGNALAEIIRPQRTATRPTSE
jgi:hypothetical protein